MPRETGRSPIPRDREQRRARRHERRRATPTAPSHRPGALGRALLLVQLLLLPLAFSRHTREAFESTKVAILALIAVALLALAATRVVRAPRAAGVLPRARELLRDPVVLSMVLLAASAVVSTATSISPWVSLLGTHESFAGLFTMLAYVVLFFATRWLCAHVTDTRRLLLAPVIAGMVAAAYAVVQVAGIDPIGWDRVSGIGRFVRPFATMGHPNFLSAFLVMTLPLTAAFVLLAVGRRQWMAASLLGASCLLSGVAIAASVSRGAWLAFACTLVVLVAGWLAVGERRSAATLGGLVAAAVVVLLLIALPSGGAGSVLSAVGQRARQITDSASRQHIWSGALGVFRAHPVFGSGLDTFQIAFSRQRTVRYWLIEWNASPTKAHNEALQILATQGAVGGVAVLVLTGGLVLVSARAIRRARREDKPLIVAMAAAVVGFYVQDVFSFTVAGTGTLFVTLAALLSGLAREGPGPSPEPPEPLERFAAVLVVGAALALMAIFHNVGESTLLDEPGRMSGALVVAVSLGLASLAGFSLEQHGRPPLFSRTAARGATAPLAPSRGLAVAVVWAGAAGLAWLIAIRPVQASWAAHEGVRLGAVDPRLGIERLVRAAGLDPMNEQQWVRLGAARHDLAKATRDRDERRRLLARAREAFERSIRLAAANSYNHANLGRVLGDLVREGMATPAEAWSAFDRALTLDPNNAYFYSDAASTALGLGDRERARQYAERGSALYPGFALVRAQLGHLALAEGAQEQAARILGEALAADWHGAERARAAAASNLAAAHLGLGRPAEAKRAARLALERNPGYAHARFNLGKALELLGRRAEAIEEFRHVLRDQPDYDLAREALRGLGAP